LIRAAAVLAFAAALATSGADFNAVRSGNQPAAHVVVAPRTAAVFAGGSLRMHAVVIGASTDNEPITWWLFGAGHIDGDGTYHAPAVSGDVVSIVAATKGAAAASRVDVVAPPAALAPLAIVACFGDGSLDVRKSGGDDSFGRLAVGDALGGIAVSTDGAVAFATDGERVVSIDLNAMSANQSKPIAGARFSEAAALRDGLFAATNANAGEHDAGVFIFRASAASVPQLLASAPAGDTPEGLAVGPDGKTLYVTGVNSDSVMRFAVAGDGSLRRTGWAQTGTRPFGVALAARRGLLLVADNDTPTLSGRASRPGLEFYALASMRRIGQSIATGSANALPLGIAVDEREDRAFVTNEGDDDVAVYSLRTFARQATLRVGRTPWLPAVDPRRDLLYVADARDDTIDIFDTRTLHLRARAETCAYPIDIGVAR
jgi:DNA-binding beta-propeller fold protein YncE